MFFWKKKKVVKTNEKECDFVQLNAVVDCDCTQDCESGTVIMTIDDVIDMQEQTGTTGEVENGSIKALDKICIADADGNILERNITVDEVYKYVDDGEGDGEVDFNAEAFPGDGVSVHFVCKTKVKVGMKIVK